MKKVVAVVVTYNRLAKLRKLAELLLQSKLSGIVVVNNASDDGTEEYLASISDGRLQVLTLAENTGASGGFYQGMKYAHTAIAEYDWLLIQDDDAYPDSKALDDFIDSQDKAGVDAVMAAVYYPSGKICEMNRPGFLPFKGFSQAVATIVQGNKGFHLSDSDYHLQNLVKVDFASFVGLFVSKRLVQATGYPDENWFIYGDDLDYSVNFTKKGFNLFFDPKLIFWHDCESLNAKNPNQKYYTVLWRTYFTYRNGLIIYKKLSGTLFPLVLIFKLASWLAAARHYPEKTSYLKMLAVAVKDGLTNNRRKKLADINKLIG